jgi:hypothetical protein
VGGNACNSSKTPPEIEQVELLRSYARCLQGIGTADINKYIQRFWEQPRIGSIWELYQMAPEETAMVSGCHSILRWEKGKGDLANSPQARVCGQPAWGKTGVVIGVNNTLPRSIYRGNLFDCTAAVLVPKDEEFVTAVATYAYSKSFYDEVRKVDEGLSVTESSFLKVPFELNAWTTAAKEKFPNGLPLPTTNDPTQWCFTGRITDADDPLQVTVARLLGYRWPDQSSDADHLDGLADKDGIVCIPAARGEPPASERLLEMLQASYGKKWTASVLQTLLAAAGCKPGTTLDEWLRSSYFEQHCRRFHGRPFIWHIWDGHKDGFSCLLNYHKFNHKTLENLTYSYLGDWIKTQSAEAKAGKIGADLWLAAAQALQEKLKLLLAGEPPYDIFIRWKPLSEQAIGWHPDLNDGVRMNIRPFMEAGILRKNPNIKWTKDRGKEPERDKDEYPWFWDGKTFVGDRVNDVHLTNAEKQAARKGAK